ncbi:MAG TPA: tetratricopeptide repeat protein, partial [Trueperaceae bacterium]|nr:tetratricopeptide repeat protein [Trueperaceae bacterium]
AESVNDKAVLSHALASRIVALARLGRFDESLALMPRAVEAAYASASTIKVADVAMLVGSALLDMGELEAGMRWIVFGRDTALGIDGRECAANGLWLSGVAQMTKRQHVQALADFDRSLVVAAGTAWEPFLYSVEASKAACRFQVGEVSAVSDLHRQVERAESMRDAYGRWTAALHLADALFDLQRYEEVLPHLEGALAWFRDRGMKPYVLRTLRALARVKRALGRDAEAGSAEAEADELQAQLPAGPFDLTALGEPGRVAVAL